MTSTSPVIPANTSAATVVDLAPVPAAASTAPAPATTVTAKVVRPRAKRLLKQVPVPAPVTTVTSAAPAKKTRARTKPPVMEVAPALPNRAPAKATEKSAALPVNSARKSVTLPVKAAAPKAGGEKLLKDKKLKLVRDSFTIPKAEYLMIEQLKQRSGMLGNSAKKSELIRAGIKALAAMSDANFLAAIKNVPTLKTGRPSRD